MALGPDVIKKTFCPLTVTHVERLIDEGIRNYGENTHANQGSPGSPQLEFVIDATCGELEREELAKRYIDAGWDYLSLVTGNSTHPSMGLTKKMTVRIGKHPKPPNAPISRGPWALEGEGPSVKYPGDAASVRPPLGE